MVCAKTVVSGEFRLTLWQSLLGTGSVGARLLIVEVLVLILIWGFKSYVRLLGIVTLVCGTCQNPAAQRVVSRIRKFTFFWIPLFPVKRETLMTCTFCGSVAALTKEEAATLIAQMPNLPGATGGTGAAGAPGTPTSAPTQLPASDNGQPWAN